MEQAQSVSSRVIPLQRPQPHWMRAVERQRSGDIAGAILHLSSHLAEQPCDVAAWVALSAAQRREGHLDAAMAALQRALRLAPQDAVVWSNLGEAWLGLGQTEQALRAHRRAVTLAPLRVDLALHCAAALRELQHFHEAGQLLDACLAREPGRADLRYERALLCLYTGRWREAWPDYGAGPCLPQPVLAQDAAPWAGERIGGKRVLLLAGSDPGESLWAARYIALLARRGAALSLAADAALHPLLADLPVRLLRPDDERLRSEAFDFHAPLPHLPWLVDPRGTTIPEPTALNTAAGSVPPALDCAPDEDPCLRVGVAWDTAAPRTGLPWAAPGAERFADLALQPGVRLVSLQPGRHGAPASGATQAHAAGYADCGLDHSTLAAVTATLDVVITTDNLVAHVAGSLGKPVLTLLRFTPHWIWGVRGESTPWYPTMRLLRQRRPGDWDSVFDEMRALVRGWARVRLREARRTAKARNGDGRRTWF